jgi:DNA-binding NarL/FixJ family response regulator
MQDAVFQILFLGERPSWQRVSRLLAEPVVSVRVQPVDSLAEAFQALAVGTWEALVIDVHSWNFQGLHYVEKVRSEYPHLPIVALFSRSIPELDTKARTCGASRCIALDELTPTSLHKTVSSALNGAKPIFPLERESKTHVPAKESDTSTLTFTKNQIITHALNNLLCIISANAELLSDSLNGSADESRPLTEIKKATRSAAALMRHLK